MGSQRPFCRQRPSLHGFVLCVVGNPSPAEWLYRPGAVGACSHTYLLDARLFLLQNDSVLDKDLAHDCAGSMMPSNEGRQEAGAGEASSSGMTRHGGTARLGQSAWCRRCRECLSEVLLPVTVVVLGVGFSLAALWVSMRRMLEPPAPR